MSMNLIAMLVSLAMMLTGAGGAAQPEALPVAETARTLTVSNVAVNWNGETLNLAPKGRVGVSTDGVRAVYDFSVDLNGKTMLPVQVTADEAGVTALTVKNGQAVTVTAGALEGLVSQLQAQMNAAMGAADGDQARLAQFITEEYLPAYSGLLRLAMDPDQRDRIGATAQAVYDRVVDRGAGTPATLEVSGEKYDVTAYSYSLDAMQMAALTDAAYTEIPELNDYYSAMFKLYGMLPEESGLRGLDSFAALFERFGVQMRLDVDEKRSADGAANEMDGVLTIDVNSMLTVPHADAATADALAKTEPEGGDEVQAGLLGSDGASLESSLEAEVADAGEDAATGDSAPAAEPAPAEPIVMNLHRLKTPAYSESNLSCSYAVDGHRGVDIAMTSTDSAGVQELNATVTMTRNGYKTHGGRISGLVIRDDAGNLSYNLDMKAIRQDVARVEAAIFGTQNPDGTSENSAAFEVRTKDVNAALSFDVDVTADAVEDIDPGKSAVVVDDLSEAGLKKLAQNPAAIGALMQMTGALAVDFNQLKADPGLKSLWGLARGRTLPIDVDELEEEADIDFDFGDEPEGDDGDYDLVMDEDGEYALVPGDGDGTTFDFDEEPVEDDGVLAFAEPRLSWLPGGWTVSATESDTAYDWVQMSIVDGDGTEAAYAIFFLDPEAETANYIVQDDGKVVDGRMMNVTDFGEGGLSVTVSEGGMYGNLMFTSEAIELDTIGRIVAGIEF